MRDRTREEQLDTHQHVTAMLEQAKAALDVGLLSEIRRADQVNDLARIVRMEPGAVVIACFAILMHDVGKEFNAYGCDFDKLTEKMLAVMADENEFFHRILRFPYKKQWWRRSS